MPHYRKPLAIAIALAVAAGAAGTAVAKPTGPEAAAKAASRAKLMAEHRGGTLRLVAKGAGGTLDPQVNYTLQYWQLYRSTYDSLLAFKNAAGTKAFTIVPDLVTSHPEADRRRQDLEVHAPQGHQVLERQGADRQGRAVLVRAHLQGPHPDRGRLLQRARRRRGVPQDARDLHPLEGRRGRPEGQHGHVPPDAARRGVARQDRRAARHDPARRDAEQGRGHHAAARHRRVHVHEVRPEPPARARAQPELQGVVGGRAARRLPRQDHATRSASRSRPRSRRSRTARPTGRSTRRRPTASTRSARSTPRRCTSTRSSRTGTCR